MRILHPLKNPLYRRLFSAQVIALSGTGIATVALGLLAYRLNPEHAGAVLGTALAIKMIAYVLVAPAASALFAWISRRNLLVSADIVRLVAVVLLPFATDIWQLYLLVFVLQAASATFTPAFQAMIPQVITDEDEYTYALSLSRLAYDLEAALSPLCAAVVLMVLPGPQLFWITAAGFSCSAAIVATSALPRRTGLAEQERMCIGRTRSLVSAEKHSILGMLVMGGTRALGELRQGVSRMRAGFAYFGVDPALRTLIALNVAVSFGGAFVLVQTVVIVRGPLGGGESFVAVMLAINGLGSMVGAFTVPSVLARIGIARTQLVGALVLAGAMLALTAAVLVTSVENLPVVLGVLWMAIGFGWAVVETPVGQLLRQRVAPAELPDVFAAQFSLSHLCWLMAYPVVGWVGGLGLTTSIGVLAALTCTGTVLAWSSMRGWRVRQKLTCENRAGDHGTPRTGTVRQA
ncbi:MFS transporter [Devriesea agamarum]|uniref:MFS transporter n=1 Tax=Devriesea agamarum TaxID=472569 RepID=UPI00155F2180|nr:MFS transporter [Devriesea agamarum]